LVDRLDDHLHDLRQLDWKGKKQFALKE